MFEMNRKKLNDDPGERLSAVIQVLQQPDPKSIGFVVRFLTFLKNILF